jgi:hypothetical protein
MRALGAAPFFGSAQADAGGGIWKVHTLRDQEDANRVVQRRFGANRELQYLMEHWAETNKKQ